MPGVRRAIFSLAILVLNSSGIGVADEKSAPRPLSLNELSMEVAALRALYQFDFTPVQLETLKKAAQETSQPAGARPVAQATEKFRQTMTDLRNALIKRTDAESILNLQQQVEDLRDSEHPAMDDGWEITEEARTRAAEIFRLLSARQVVSYLSFSAEQFSDPVELVTEALDKVRELKADEWKELREVLGEEAGRLACGLDAQKASQVGDKVIQLLIQTRAMKSEEFKKEHAALVKSVREILGNPSSLDVIRHSVEYALAELLSNPRLAVAITALSTP